MSGMRVPLFIQVKVGGGVMLLKGKDLPKLPRRANTVEVE